MSKAVLGIIGGSGLYDLPGIDDVRECRVSTPWGEPSDAFVRGRVGVTEVVFLPRHGRGHRIPPHEINYRANIDGFKQLGVTDLVSFSACGSYKEALSPGTFVLVDNFVDRTVHRAGTFFGTGCVAHVSFAHPVGPRPAGPSRDGGQGRGHSLPARRRGRLHGGPAVLDPAGVADLPAARLRRHPHDLDAGSEARARGGDHLRGGRDGDRLRLLARRSTARSTSPGWCA